MSSIIAFLNAVGPNIEGLDMGDLSHLESIAERDRFFALVPITSSGRKLTIPIPAGRKFVIVSINIAAAIAATTSSRCYVNLNFGGQKFDNLYYDYTLDSTTKIKQGSYSHFLTGDGNRSITLDVTRHTGVEGQVILMGYYASRAGADAKPVTDLTATELSPSEIQLRWLAPLDSGGFPIIAYRIRRGDTVADDGTITNFAGLTDLQVSPQQNENEITYTDRNLQHRTTYYYEVTAITRDLTGTNRLGEPSAIVSATTEVDHPAHVTGVTARAVGSGQIRLEWNPVTDTGGVPLQGYNIRRSHTGPNGPYLNIVSNTNSLIISYTDVNLSPNTIYYYRILAINTDGKFSLAPSTPVVGTDAPYRPPTNIRSSISSDGTSVQLFWDESTDLRGVGVGGYRIQRSTDNITYETITDNTGSRRTNYTDNNVEGATIYYYRIIGLSSGTTVFLTPPSQPHQVSIPVHAPSSVQLSVTPVTDTRISLSWTDPQHTGGSSITGFKLQRSKSIGFPDGSGDEQTLEKEETPNAVIDGSATVSDTITVSNAENFVIAAVEVDVNIAHVHRGDIEILLTAPDGQVFTLKTVDFGDAVDNIIETYSGEILNGLIGRSTEGTWTLSVNDRFEPLDDGRWNSWAIRFIRATDALTEITIPGASVRSYEDSGLDEETRYYYRIRTTNAAGLNSKFSNTMNTVTPESIFGDGRLGDLVVASGVRHRLFGSTEFDNVTIEDGGVLLAVYTILKCRGTYTEIGNGHIEIEPRGCEGGIAGMSVHGQGGHSNISSGGIRTTEPTNGSLIPPTAAADCTPIAVVNDAANDILSNHDEFIRKFRNEIRGGRGSDGTPASPSGDGGAYGDLIQVGRGRRRHLVGGRGGQGAHGVNGVMGGGKFALIARSIDRNTIPTIIAKGIDGLDGNQGTGERGGRGETSFAARNQAQDGTAASIFGTAGSNGSTGGTVFVIYEHLNTLIRTHDTFTSGTEGFVLTENTPADESALTHEDGEMVLTINGASGGTKLSKTYDLPDRGTNDTVLTFDWQYIGNTNVGGANRFFFVLRDADTDAELYRERLGSPSIADSGRQTKSIDITGILDARTSIKLEFETPPYLRTDFMVRRFFDNVVIEYPLVSAPEILDIRLNTSGIDISGGQGGRNGGTPDLHPLNTRAPNGPDGILIESRLSDL